jgi:DHA3 family macrolide efflux protein-like MFS transporter
MTTSDRRKLPGGMIGFTIVCLGQIVSVLASSMTGFALTIYVFEQTSQATALGIMTTSFIAPFLIFSPIAGALVDRYNRKLMMMISDLTAGLGTVAVLILFATDSLQIWHFYIVNVFIGVGTTFQWPAYASAMSTMIPKEQLGRANGLMSLVNSGPGVVAPLLAGALLPYIGITGILLIDATTFIVAIGALLLVDIPNPERTLEGQAGEGGLLKEATYGFQYIFKRPSLIYLQILLLLSNIFIGFRNTLMAPMILSRTGNDSLVFGSVQSAAAIAAVGGGLLMSAWGGFKRRITGLLLGWGMYFVFGIFLMGLGRDLRVWIPASVVASVMAILGSTSANALWQSKVAPDVQGRVFSARRLIAWVPEPVTPLIAGPLADFVMEPAMSSGGGMAEAFGWMVGNEAGAGMSLLIILCSFGGMIALASGFIIPAVRNVEDILPDHDQLEKAEPIEGESAEG